MGIICSRSDGVLDLASFRFFLFAPKLMIRREFKWRPFSEA